jgi:hypothetical protein
VLSEDVWYNIVVTYDKVNVSPYLDGSPTGFQFAENRDLIDNSVDFGLASNSDGSGEFANIISDEVRIYNRALNSTELSSLYENNYVVGNTFNGNTTSTAYYWDFGETRVFRYGFGYGFQEDVIAKMLNCTYPKTQTLVNVTYYPYVNAVPSSYYSVYMYNATHKILVLSDACINLYGDNYKFYTNIVPETGITLETFTVILSLMTFICGLIAFYKPFIGLGIIFLDIICSPFLGLAGDDLNSILFPVSIMICGVFMFAGIMKKPK